MGLVPLLIVFPFVIGLLLLATSSDRIRSWIVWPITALLITGTIALAGRYFPGELVNFVVGVQALSWTMLAASVCMTLFIFYVGLRAQRPLIILLLLAQAAIILPLELSHIREAHEFANLFVDKFSIIMGAIIGIVGSLVCVYATGYMREFHKQHPEIRDRRRVFFCVLYVFLGAMFGVVFSNNLLWLYFFWEITTLASYLLIGYKRDEVSNRNALRALTMNLAGGVGFAVGVWIFQHYTHSLLLTDMLNPVNAKFALIPAAAFCFAGMTKSAQYPFARWLLGAMVAPTPVSALLHSSTMVKAGVYLIVRMAPIMQDTPVGVIVALVGAVTFLMGSITAMAQSDAKKVLAYSTIANLGLIVLCGGIGTYQAVWAAILLIIFHAVAKGLLFLCVGVVEHEVHSRDIESMSGLVLRMPRVAVMMQIGMAGMFLAPFGMLISKWAVLKAVVDAFPLLAVFVIFGSAPTLFFWVKWMGKLIEVTGPNQASEKRIARGEWTALVALSAFTFAACAFYPLISSLFIVPYVTEVYGHAQSEVLAASNILIMAIMLGMLALFPLSFLRYGRAVKVMDPYLGGANTDIPTQFTGALGRPRDMQMSNYYLSRYLPEAPLLRVGNMIASVLLVGLFLWSLP